MIQPSWKNIDNMRQDNIGYWLMKDTRKLGDNLYKEVKIFHIFNHNNNIGSRADNLLWKRAGIILSKRFIRHGKTLDN